MKKAIRALLITGNERRHRYVAQTLAERFDLVRVVAEEKGKVHSRQIHSPDPDIQRHFESREKVDNRYLGEPDFPKSVDLLEVGRGKSYSNDTLVWTRSRKPDVVVLYGCGIIKPPLLDFYKGKMINIHLGLSPYYRGSGTNFWPLADGIPECVGVTIHLAVADVDAGSILAQVRPEPRIDDSSHTLGTKAIGLMTVPIPWEQKPLFPG